MTDEAILALLTPIYVKAKGHEPQTHELFYYVRENWKELLEIVTSNGQTKTQFSTFLHCFLRDKAFIINNKERQRIMKLAQRALSKGDSLDGKLAVQIAKEINLNRGIQVPPVVVQRFFKFVTDSDEDSSEKPPDSGDPATKTANIIKIAVKPIADHELMPKVTNSYFQNSVNLTEESKLLGQQLLLKIQQQNAKFETGLTAYDLYLDET